MPGLAARYSFGWDSSQFDRGAVNGFDIVRHQPHPPGYPLWVLAIRGILPLAGGNPNRAQVVLALLFTIAGLWFFRKLAQNFLDGHATTAAAATTLLAFSPLTCLYASSSQVYAVDFFVSCFGGWLAYELWCGRGAGSLIWALPVIAIAAGFRPSGATFLMPLLAAAMLRSGALKTRPLQSVGAVAAAALCWLAWLTPTAFSVGGFNKLAELNRVQAATSFAKTSIFYGAPALTHVHMIGEATIYLGFAIAAFLPLLPGYLMRPSKPRHPLFFAIWMAPNLGVLYLLHCSQPGYLMASLPPLALLLASLTREKLQSARWIAAAVAAALLVTYLPYERFRDMNAHTVPFLFLRATPRISRLVEASQRDIQIAIGQMPGPNKLVYGAFQRFEAPNIRSVTFDFPGVEWRDDSRAPVPENIQSVAWLFAGTEIPSHLRERFPQLQNTAGNQLYSFWTVEPAGQTALLEALRKSP